MGPPTAPKAIYFSFNTVQYCVPKACKTNEHTKTHEAMKSNQSAEKPHEEEKQYF